MRVVLRIEIFSKRQSLVVTTFHAIELRAIGDQIDSVWRVLLHLNL